MICGEMAHFLLNIYRSLDQYFCGPNAQRSKKQELTEKKNQAMGKAMVPPLTFSKFPLPYTFFHLPSTWMTFSIKVTLGITEKNEYPVIEKKAGGKRKRVSSSVPTPSNIYRELMASANREPLPMYQKAPPVHDAGIYECWLRQLCAWP